MRVLAVNVSVRSPPICSAACSGAACWLFYGVIKIVGAPACSDWRRVGSKMARVFSDIAVVKRRLRSLQFSMDLQALLWHWSKPRMGLDAPGARHWKCELAHGNLGLAELLHALIP